MSTSTTKAQGLTRYSRLFFWGAVMPLLLIAGIQLFILSGQTETYFAWTFASPLAAAFMGAGYWSAMSFAYLGTRVRGWEYIRSSMPPSLTATTLLAVTTFLHLENFHLDSPLFITRFVTWVWIAVYVVVPPALLLAWIIQSRSAGRHVKGRHPLPAWIRSGFVLLAVFALACGIGLFIVPEFMSTLWPWAVKPLAARAVGSWLSTFGVACAALVFENDIELGAGTSSSLLAFCVLQMVVVARYASAIEWGKPMAAAYIAFLIVGAVVSGANLLANSKLSK